MRFKIKIFLIITLFFITINSSFAEKYLKIEKNITYLTKKNSELIKQFDSGKLKIDIIGNEKVKIIEKDNRLAIFVSHGLYNLNLDLEIKYNKKQVKIPIKIDIDFLETDFDIYDSLFQINLQKKSLSCESSATSDIISYILSKNISEDDVISVLEKSSYYNKLPEKYEDSWIWGNPQKGFVGYIDHTDNFLAKQKFLTGYGVYEKPIKKVYERYGLKAEIIDSSIGDDFGKIPHLSYLLNELKDGKMVQLWGDRCTDENYEDGILETKDDLTYLKAKKKINAKNYCYSIYEDRTLEWYYKNDENELIKNIGLNGEHAFILLGWKGDIKNPTYIKVWDTNTGYHIYETIEWFRKWEMMDYKSIVISNK